MANVGPCQSKRQSCAVHFFSTFGMHVDFEATLLCGHGQEFDHGHPISASSLVIIVIGAILDEVAANLEASLLTQPVPQGAPPQHPMHAFEIQQHYSFSSIMLHLIFTCLGALMGKHLPRTQPAVRHPTRLRVV